MKSERNARKVLLVSAVFISFSFFTGCSVESIIGQTIVDENAVKGQMFVLENVRVITDGSKSFRNPVWSPDGTMIACVADGIWVLDSDGRNARQVVKESTAILTNWLPGSEHILFRTKETIRTARRLQSTVHIKVANVQTGETITVYSGSNTDVRVPLVTSNGYVAIRNEKDKKSYLFDVSGVEIMTARDEKILYTARDEIGAFKLIVSNADGSNEQIITHLQSVNYSFSPDGNKMVYNHGDGISVFEINTNSTIDLGKGDRPRWSPDSEYIIYIVTEDDGHFITGSEIYVINADGTGRTQLTFTPDEIELSPHWSPAGKKIAYYSEKSGRIFTADIIKK